MTFASDIASTSSLLTGFVDVLSVTFSPLIGLRDGLGSGVSPLAGLEVFLVTIAAALPGWTGFWRVGPAPLRTLTVNCDEIFGSALDW